jgi:anti-sigma factor RsiW
VTNQNHERHLSAELMQGFLDEEVSPREADRVRSHAASCARCRSELDAWKTLFADLGELGEIAPHAGFRERVLHALPSFAEPAPVSVRERLTRWLPKPLRVRREQGSGVAVTHPAPGPLQDFLEGLLPRTEALRIEGHLHACRDCRREVEGWRNVLVKLDSLPAFSPSPELGERVMAHVRVQLAAQTARPSPAERLQLFLGSVTPKTRKRMAAVAGAGITPAVTLALVAYVVFSHPLVTPGNLLSFLWLRGSERLVGLMGGVLDRVTESALLLRTFEGMETLIGSPASAALAVTGVAALTLSATWVLYRNVLATPNAGKRYVR